MRPTGPRVCGDTVCRGHAAQNSYRVSGILLNLVKAAAGSAQAPRGRRLNICEDRVWCAIMDLGPATGKPIGSSHAATSPTLGDQGG